ncbi:MAG TPA: ATP-binding protein [Verrucomicrobiae bacterium]|nr:ATP-binding protein [Verrucomicrobiae bacterium]
MIARLSSLLTPSRPEPAERARRIAAMQLHVVLPAKIGLAAVALYYLHADWFSETSSTYLVVLETLERYSFIYLIYNVAAGAVFYLWRRLPAGLVPWLAFITGLWDGIFMAGLTFITGGFGSITYWIFPALIVLNAISIPLALPQIVLNLLLSVFYLSAGFLAMNVPMPELWVPPAINIRSTPAWRGPIEETNEMARNRPRNTRLQVGQLPYNLDTADTTVSSEALYPRLFVLWLLTACCYGVQLLVARQREALKEAQEFAARESHLRSAGRLAAEIAHQLKNPLAVINNVAFSLQRSLPENKDSAARQIRIIQEEVARADRVLTQIMGYAQLSEGRVEKLDVVEELERALAQVFPPAVPTHIQIHREYAPPFPPLLMQRQHLAEILINLIKNAREALGDRGNLFVGAECRPDSSIEISVRDDGPGIPPDRTERIFEAFYSTKEKGTGLGLAIVKHNVELYGGKVQVDSEIGIGTRFAIIFPSRTILNETS